MKKLFAVLLLVVFVLHLRGVVFAVSYPSPVGYINDFAKLFSARLAAKTGIKVKFG